jgi:cell shape-determining protein MreC
MAASQSPPSDKKYPQAIFSLILKGIWFLVSSIFSITKRIHTFVNRINEQSKLIETLQTQNAEIEQLREKVLSIEKDVIMVETLRNQLYECQSKIVLLQIGRRFTKSRI